MASGRPSPQSSPDTSEHAAASHAPEAPEPLTAEWVEWFAAKVSACRVDSQCDLTIQHRIVDAETGEFCWHVRLEGGRVAVATGLAESTDPQANRVTFISDRDTARAIAADGASAARSFLSGNLRIEGDVRLLIAARPALETLDDALAAPSVPK